MLITIKFDGLSPKEMQELINEHIEKGVCCEIIELKSTHIKHKNHTTKELKNMYDLTDSY